MSRLEMIIKSLCGISENLGNRTREVMGQDVFNTINGQLVEKYNDFTSEIENHFIYILKRNDEPKFETNFLLDFQEGSGVSLDNIFDDQLKMLFVNEISQLKTDDSFTDPKIARLASIGTDLSNDFFKWIIIRASKSEVMKTVSDRVLPEFKTKIENESVYKLKIAQKYAFWLRKLYFTKLDDTSKEFIFVPNETVDPSRDEYINNLKSTFKNFLAPYKNALDDLFVNICCANLRKSFTRVEIETLSSVFTPKSLLSKILMESKTLSPTDKANMEEKFRNLVIPGIENLERGYFQVKCNEIFIKSYQNFFIDYLTTNAADAKVGFEDYKQDTQDSQASTGEYNPLNFERTKFYLSHSIAVSFARIMTEKQNSDLLDQLRDKYLGFFRKYFIDLVQAEGRKNFLLKLFSSMDMKILAETPLETKFSLYLEKLLEDSMNLSAIIDSVQTDDLTHIKEKMISMRKIFSESENLERIFINESEFSKVTLKNYIDNFIDTADKNALINDFIECLKDFYLYPRKIKNNKSISKKIWNDFDIDFPFFISVENDILAHVSIDKKIDEILNELKSNESNPTLSSFKNTLLGILKAIRMQVEPKLFEKFPIPTDTEILEALVIKKTKRPEEPSPRDPKKTNSNGSAWIYWFFGGLLLAILAGGFYYYRLYIKGQGF